MWDAWQPEIIALLTFSGAIILLTAAAHDLIARTAPNWMALVLTLLGIACRLLDGRIGVGLLAACIVFFISAACWRRGWLGGGDVKLLSAAALVVPPHTVLSFIVAMSLSGSVLALIYLAARGFVAAPGATRPHSLFARAMRVERWRIRRGGPLPYACAIAAGFLFILL